MLVNSIIGVGGLNSASKGAKIVISLAEKLQIPIAVAANKVGNSSTVFIYARVKTPVTPHLANTTKRGIRATCEEPKKIMQTPPMACMVKQIAKDDF